MSDNLPPLREVIKIHGLAAKKSLGQNFLCDLNVTTKIARLAGSLHDHDVLEIGPGPGGLTRALLASGARHVHVIERDERLKPVLDEISAAYPGRLSVHFGDALAMDWPQNMTSPVRIVSNLPYNIGTELLVRWLREDWPPFWASLTLMFQKEVAERITAKAGDRHWGRLGVLANWRADAKMVYHLPPQAFVPPPKVHSALVHLVPCAPKVDVSLEAIESIAKAAFSQRRKMLRAALRGLDSEADRLIQEIGIDPTRRAETLNLAEFADLARVFVKSK